MEVHLELMGTIKELPVLDRPREKALRYGLPSLSDIELLTLLISSGYKGSSALEISTELITKFNGLSNLTRTSLAELQKVKGIKKAKALNLAAIFELNNRLIEKSVQEEEVEVNSEYLYQKYKTKLLNSNQELLIIIILSRKNRITHEKTLYVGTKNSISYSYHDIYRELLNHQGRYFYLIHNHPGTSSSPSKEDIIFTSELFIQSTRIKIPLIDHIIIGEDGYYSFLKEKKKKS